MSGLHEAVARAIADNCWRVVDASDGHPSLVEDPERAAAAAIGVVLAEAQRSIEALGTEWTHARAGVTSYEPARAADFKREALAALAALGEGADARIDA